jgi:hypothetical protein
MKKKIALILASALMCYSLALGEEEIPTGFNDAPSGDPFSQTKFVPDISLILDMTGVYRNVRDGKYATFHSPEFTLVPADEDRHGHEEPYPRRGFNFNYAEITFYSIVDPYFDLFAVCGITEDAIALEEAYFTTRKLPMGLQVKAGKFLSGFGRLNEQHSHYWDFADIPLAYNAFFGEGGLNEIGARITLVLPIDFYLMLGAEALQGSNPRSFGSERFLNVDGLEITDSSNGPNLGVGYVKTSFDAGDLTVLAGASGALGKARIDHGLDRTGKSGSAFSGDAYVLGGDITLKYSIDSTRYVSLQAEYLYRRMDGDTFRNDASDVMTGSTVNKKQSGLYAQLIGKISKQWRAGARYDLLHLNRVEENGTGADLPENMPRYSGMLEYSPTEFSRFRLQYNFDATRYGTGPGGFEKEKCHEIIFQANLAIGAHGAHSF